MEGFSRSFLCKGLFLVGSILVLLEGQYLAPLKFSFWWFYVIHFVDKKRRGRLTNISKDSNMTLSRADGSVALSLAAFKWCTNANLEKTGTGHHVEACEKQLELSKSCTS